jgi:hypothetical protein
VKGQPITIGQILADFVANVIMVFILTQILHFLKKELSRCSEEMSYFVISQEPIMIQR